MIKTRLSLQGSTETNKVPWRPRATALTLAGGFPLFVFRSLEDFFSREGFYEGSCVFGRGRSSGPIMSQGRHPCGQGTADRYYSETDQKIVTFVSSYHTA